MTTTTLTNFSSSLATVTGGLVATSINGSSWVQSNDTQRIFYDTGTYYYEFTFNTVTSNPYAGLMCIGTGGWIAYEANGKIFQNGSQVGSTGTALTNGSVLCVAVNINSGLIWFRVNNGNWNNNSANNPATNVGGITLASNFVYATPSLYLSATTEQITANFGATAYTQSVPSSYINWPSPGDQTVMMVTQESAETYVTNPSTMYITQEAIEIWHNPNTGIAGSMLITQEAIEVWMSTSTFIPYASALLIGL